MPVPRGTKYRFKKLKSGKKVRLAIAPGGKVVEVKSYNELFGKKKKKK